MRNGLKTACATLTGARFRYAGRQLIVVISSGIG